MMASNPRDNSVREVLARNVRLERQSHAVCPKCGHAHGAGMSQADLAVKADVSRVTISSIENGRKSADIETIQKIAKVFGIEPAALMKP